MSTTRDPTDLAAAIAAVPYWFHQIEISPGVMTPGVDNSREKIGWWRVPNDLTDMRVLDIGCYEGFFSFEMERRGAEVVAIDLWRYGSNGFKLCKETLSSSVEYRQASVYDLDPSTFGEFDLVLFAGVLYHLRHPLLALERVRSVCRGRAIIESQICDDALILPDRSARSLPADMTSMAIAEFYPSDELNGDSSNWFSPSQACFSAWVATSGFTVDDLAVRGARACIHASIGDLVPETPAIFAR